MAPSNVLSMAQLRTLPLADQIKILMKNGGCSLDPPPPESGTDGGLGVRPEAPSAPCLELPTFTVPTAPGSPLRPGSLHHPYSSPAMRAPS